MGVQNLFYQIRHCLNKASQLYNLKKPYFISYYRNYRQISRGLLSLKVRNWCVWSMQRYSQSEKRNGHAFYLGFEPLKTYKPQLTCRAFI